MKILLVGEYSGLHHYLATGLRRLGEEVCVLSDGNLWKEYPRDINLSRPSNTIWSGFRYLFQLLLLLPRLRGYDVIQFTGPTFLSLRPEKSIHIYNYLKRHNKHLFLGAFGTDHYYVKACLDGKSYRYSDYMIGTTPHNFNEKEIKENLHGGTAVSNKLIASECNAIIACLWEYYTAYKPHYDNKLVYIPLPINLDDITSYVRPIPQKIRFFIGIQSAKHHLKGTDIMLEALKEIERDYPEDCEVTVVSDVPYERYCRMLSKADVQLDQLYSYTPSMNSLIAMAGGSVVMGGGEPENYQLINEEELRPIINVQPTKESVYQELEKLIKQKERIPELSRQSIEYVKKHHDCTKVAQEYLNVWRTFSRH